SSYYNINPGVDNAIFQGNVGIGTTTPYAKLSVAGQVVADYFTATSTTATSTFRNSLSVGTTTSTSTAKLRLDGAFNITSSNGAVVIGDTSGNARGVGALDIQASRPSNLYVASGVSAVAVGNQLLALGVSSVAMGNENIALALYASALGAGNTASGSFSTSIGYQNTANDYQSVAVGRGNSVAINGSSAFGAGITNAIATSTMIGPSDESKLTILGATGSVGYVGIGTTSPYAKLSVVGEIVGAYFTGTTTATSTFGGGINLATGCYAVAGTCIGGAGGSGTVESGTTGQFGYYAANGTTLTATSTLFLDTTGNIGVGTSSPWTKLSVSGNLDAQRYYINGTTLAHASGTNYWLAGATPTTTASVTDTDNLSIGFGAGGDITTSHGNVFVGNYAGYVNSTGGYNTFLGRSAGSANISGQANTFSGYCAGCNNTIGGGNSFFGAYAGVDNTTASNNTFLGYTAGLQNTTGSSNVFVGYGAGDGNITGTGNTYLGSNAGFYPNGSYNTFLGYGTGPSTSATSSIGIGYDSIITANNQLVIGSSNANGAITDAYFGSGVTKASPAGITINSTGGSGLNNAGASLTIAGGKSTGTATPGSIVFQTSTTGSSGSTLQSLAERMRINGVTGNVGIGTTSPYAKLSVVGEIVGAYFTGTTTATSTFGGGINLATGCYAIAGTCLSAGGGSGTVNSGTQGQIAFYDAVGTAVSGTSTINISTASKIGFNTSSLLSNVDYQFQGRGATYPQLSLIRNDSSTTADEALGTIMFGSVDSNVAAAAGMSSYASEGFTGTINGAYLTFSTTPNGSAAIAERMRITDQGYIGIGTTSPTAMLTVNGDIAAANLTATGTVTASTFTTGSASLTSSTLSANIIRAFGTSNTSLQLNGRAFTGFGTMISMIGSSASFSNTSGQSYGVSITPNYNQASGSGANTDLQIQRAETAIGSGLQYLISAEVGGSLNSFATSTKFSVDRTGLGYFAGNVGIGTTSPYAKLSIHANNGETNTTLFNISSSTVAATSSFLTVLNNGNVGIGTSNPGSLLEVSGGIASIGVTSANIATALSISNTHSNAGTDRGVRMQFMGGGGLVPLSYINSAYSDNTGNSGYLSFSTRTGNSSPSEKMRIDANGNVGIGTSSPYAKLSVSGAIVGEYFHSTSTIATSTFAGGLNVGNGALKYDFSSGVTTIDNLELGSQSFDTNAGIITWIDMPVTSAATAGIVQSYSANIDGTSILTIYSESDGLGGIQNTRVGIGTTSPASTLTVVGSACISVGTGATAACSTTAGTITASVFNTAAADLAERYDTQDLSIEAGDIVMVDGEKDMSIKKAVRGAGSILGIISTEPGFLLGYSNNSTSTRPVALAGRVPIKVSTENGEIKRGDDLTLSTIPGVAAKAKFGDPVIATALTEIIASSTVTAFVRPHFTSFAPLDVEVPTQASLFAVFRDLMSGSQQWMSAQISATTGFFKNIFADRVTTKELCLGDEDDQVCVTKDQLKSLLQDSGIDAELTGEVIITPAESEPVASSTSPIVEPEEPAEPAVVVEEPAAVEPIVEAEPVAESPSESVPEAAPETTPE
ncbi:MAG: hypothetical protein M3Q73_02495, partial [bacterium]|nr:hypothetical protein [bacterium]